MSDPDSSITDAIFAAFDPGGAGTTKLAKLTGWPVSTIHSWKAAQSIPGYRRLDIVRAALDAHIKAPDEYKAPVELSDAMLDYLDPDRLIMTDARVALVRTNNGRTPQGEAEKGAARAEENAEHVEPGWSAKAYAFLAAYADHHARFLGEDVRLAAMASDSPVPIPPAPGAWGNVFKRAAKAGIIKKVGYEPSKLASTHGKAAVCWLTL